VSQLKTWFSENSTLVVFLAAQAVAIAVGAASLLTYGVQLENRVHTMETRGAEYTVSRMQAIEHRLTLTESATAANAASILRIVEVLTRDLPSGARPRLP